MKKLLNKEIATLKLSKEIKRKLSENNINTILELCNFSRIELGALNLTNPEINDIAIALQLVGVDLKRNHAKRNTSISNI